jgi:uncharacterized protein RhaS with RHS repeats
LQRFISEDPIGLAGSTNLYNYVANSPLGYTDPLGLKEKGNGYWIAAGAAAAAPALAPAAESAPVVSTEVAATEVATTVGGGAAGAGLGDILLLEHAALCSVL